MTKIYKLIDPETNDIKYIGKTKESLKKRLSGHITKAKKSRISHVSCWIYSLLEKNKKPLIELIEECENWIEREQYFISIYPNLCNHSIGGESGTLGYKMSLEHKEKISNSLKGKSRTEITKLKISNSHKGKILSDSTKEKIKQCNIGKKLSMETRIKKSKYLILQFSRENELIKEWFTLGQIEEELGYLKSNIWSCCSGRLKTAYGFVWSYKNKDIVES